MIDVLVVGGGITGLSAAWEAALGGADVALVEAAPRFGGKVRTERVDGCLVEHGPDSFITYKPAALQLAHELGLGDQVIGAQEPRSVDLRVAGRMHPLPDGMGLVLPTRLGPFARTRILTLPQKARAGLDVLLPRMLDEQDVAIGTLLRRRLGDGVVDRFADPLLGGIYGARVDDLSLDAVLPSLRTSEAEHRSLVLASLAQGRAARRRGDRGTSPFRSLRAGMGALVDALTSALHETDVDLRTATSAEALEPTVAGVRVQLSTGAVVDARAVILACPAAAMGPLLEPLTPDAARDLAALPQGSTTSVTLGFSSTDFAEPPTGHGYLEAGPDPAPVSGVTLTSNKWADRAPEGTVLVRAFVPDRVGSLAHASDPEVVTTVTAHVRAVLGATAEPHLRHIVRWRVAMPKYVVGHRARTARIETALPAGVALAGSALHGVGLPDCIADGRRLARDLLGAHAGRTVGAGGLGTPPPG